jgi:hypothetical protein
VAASRSWLRRGEVARLRLLLDQTARTRDPETALEHLAEALTRLHVARLRAEAARTPNDDASIR